MRVWFAYLRAVVICWVIIISPIVLLWLHFKIFFLPALLLSYPLLEVPQQAAREAMNRPSAAPEKPPEPNAARGKPVDVRALYHRVPVTSERVIHIVADENDHVELRRGGCH